MATPLRFPDEVVHSEPERLGGTPVFVGTRVPAQSLFDYLENGETLEELLHQFPSVRRAPPSPSIHPERAPETTMPARA